MEGDDEVNGPGRSYTTEFRQYDPVVGRWWGVDPLTHEFPLWSPFNYVKSNPILNIDPDGRKPFSTHTDEEGNVLAVRDDGDLGVYKHKGTGASALGNFEKNYSENNTSAGGEKMGETLTPLGFADFGAYEIDGTTKPGQGAKIDFNSDWADNQVSSILEVNPSAAIYALKARGGHEWDIKNNALLENKGSIYYGSKLFGKYASARDAGNIAAGAVAQKSIIPNKILDYGFGTYNMSGNKVGKSLLMIATDVTLFIGNPTSGATLMNYKAKYGEDKLSKMGIESGKSFIRNK